MNFGQSFNNLIVNVKLVCMNVYDLRLPNIHCVTMVNQEWSAWHYQRRRWRCKLSEEATRPNSSFKYRIIACFSNALWYIQLERSTWSRHTPADCKWFDSLVCATEIWIIISNASEFWHGWVPLDLHGLYESLRLLMEATGSVYTLTASSVRLRDGRRTDKIR